MENFQEKNFIRFRVIFWLFIILLWYFMGMAVNSHLILPYPHEVFMESFKLLLQENFRRNLFITITRSLIGLILSFLLGFLVGVITNRGLYQVIRGTIDIFQSNPLVVWITLALIWFGFGTFTVIFTLIIMLFPNFYLSIYNAKVNIPRKYKELFMIYPINRKEYITKFLIPYLKPYISPIFVNSLISSLKITAMAEFLATNDGIGFLLGYSKTLLNTKEIYSKEYLENAYSG